MRSNPQPIAKRKLTTTDYHQMASAGILAQDERVELINGEIINMTPIGSQHAGCVRFLQATFASACSNQVVVSTQSPVLLGEYSEPEPDLALLKPRTKDGWYAVSHPSPSEILLLIEVSDTTLAYDQDIKVPLYAKHGIPETWVVDLQHHQLLQYKTPSHDRYLDTYMAENLQQVPVSLLDGLLVDLRGLFQNM